MNRFHVELLEPRRLLASLVVTSAADPAGALVAGTLRHAVAQANQHARMGQSDTITFDTAQMRTSTVTLLRLELGLNAIGPGALVGLVTIDGGGRVTISGDHRGRVFNVFSEARVALTGLTIRDGSAGGDSGDTGGGIRTAGDLTITNCTISDNRATAIGGGIYNGGTLTVSNSTISRNTAVESGGIRSGGTLTVTNSTISGNRAFFNGGGIDNYGTLTVTNSTISNNRSSANAIGGIHNSKVGAATATIGNTIIAGNYGVDDDLAVIAKDVAGDFISLGHNLIGDGGNSTGFDAPGFPLNGDQVGTFSRPLNPSLGPLQDNGGPTQTHALLPGARAVDAGKNALAVDDSGNPLLTDQRGFGFARVFGTAVDIGAFELQPQPPPEVTFRGHSQPHLLFILAGDSLDFSGAFVDLGILSGHTVTWNFGDGSSTTTFFEPGESASFTADHAFAAPGTYVVTLTVTGDNGGVGTTQTTVIVQTPADATGSLLSYLQGLTQLNGGRQNSLESTLNGVIAALARGNATPAKNQLGAFDHKVNALFKAGLLTGAQQALLLSAADAIREEIG